MLCNQSAAREYLRANLRGVRAAVPYPFGANGNLDEADMRHNDCHYADQSRSDGLFCGDRVRLPMRSMAAAEKAAYRAGLEKSGCSALKNAA